jgi:hypothetical protein
VIDAQSMKECERMDKFTKEDLNTLAQMEGEWCLSFYLPTYKAGQDVLQNPITLKNLLRSAEGQLQDLGWRSPDAQELLQPVRDLVMDGDFWQHQGHGLAIFLAPGVFQHYRTALHFDSLVFVTRCFHLKPLLPLLTNDGEFFVLALSQGNIRLLRGTRDDVEQIDIEDADIPTSLAEALRFDVTGQQIQFHSVAREPAGTGGRRPVMFHGHGAGKDASDSDILNWFHQVDKGIQEYLRDKRAPLVLAGVEYLHPVYREANTYNHLLERGIEGNPDDLRAEVLHQRAWEIVRPIFESSQQEVVERYRALMGQKSARASSRVEEIVPAAYQGRIDTLFVANSAQQWGTYNAADAQVDIHRQAKRGDCDLLDMAAVQTVLNGGTVYALAPDQMPGAGMAGAVFRY